jgi:soluble lytic murein transglycosylase-like protein
MPIFSKKGLLAIAMTLFASTTSASPVKTERWIMQHSKASVVQARRIAHVIHEQAQEQHLPVSLLVGIMQEESSFKPNARSKQGALGLMQVMPRLHCRKVKQCNLFNINTAVQVGTTVLTECRKKAVRRIDTLKCYTGYRSRKLTRYAQRVESHISGYKEFISGPLTLND